MQKGPSSALENTCGRHWLDLPTGALAQICLLLLSMLTFRWWAIINRSRHLGMQLDSFFSFLSKLSLFFPLLIKSRHFYSKSALLFCSNRSFVVYCTIWYIPSVPTITKHSQASNPIFSNNFSNPRKLWNHEFVGTPCILSKQERSISVLFHMPSSHLWRDEGSNSIIHGYLLSFLSSHSTSFFFWVLVVNKRAEHEQGYLAKFAQFLVFILST